MADVKDTGRLSFQTDLQGITADAVILAVGTPTLPSGGADLTYVFRAMTQVAAMDQAPQVLMIKSTVPPGTSERILAESALPELTERYVFSPEFLSLGTAVKDWNYPSRIVVGMHNPALLPMVEDLYRGLEAPWIVTTPTNAEMIKYASNAFLATKVSFINEIANLCSGLGADVEQVSAGLKLDPRIGSSYLSAGVGYGGSCFPKDTQALAHLSRLQGRSMPLLEAVIGVNNSQRLKVVTAVHDLMGNGVSGHQVAVLGLSFKPGTDDLREAPSLTVISELQAQGYQVRAWDPVVSRELIQQRFPGVEAAESLQAATHGASAAVVLTEWPEIRNAEWAGLLSRMASPFAVVDGRNCLNADEITAAGGCYRGIGR
jgi:UDPglucose 6-dehydrogenase